MVSFQGGKPGWYYFEVVQRFYLIKHSEEHTEPFWALLVTKFRLVRSCQGLQNGRESEIIKTTKTELKSAVVGPESAQV